MKGREKAKFGKTGTVPARRLARTVPVLLVIVAGAAGAADWPQYKGDAARSSIGGEALSVPLAPVWIYQPRHAPRPAWEETGKEAHRLDFDFAPHPVVAGSRVFLCSTVDDTLRVLDMNSGKLLWRFTTGGPLRFAPAVAEGKAYLACDDGWLYCLEAETGTLNWRFHAAPGDDLLLGNGRMISRWPLRSGVAVVDGVVYTAAGMWPTEGVYVYALDAQDGRVLWRNDTTGIQYVELPHPGATGFSGVAPQGYLAVSGDILLLPTGRSCPAAFNRHTGAFLYCWPHRSWDDAKRGGCWLTTTGELYFNPTREPRGTSESYVGEAAPLPKDGMVAYDIKTNKPVFQLEGKHRVLATQDTLFAVGNGEAAAYDLAMLRAGKAPAEAVKWTTPHLRVYSLAFDGKTLFVGGKGQLAAFDAATGARTWYCIQDIPGPVRALAIAGGRLIAATDQGVVTCFRPGRAWPRLNQDAPDWRLEIPGEIAALAEATAARAARHEGYVLVVGSTDARFAAALAMHSRLHVIQALRGREQTEAERDWLLHTDLYGERVALLSVPAWDRLPFAPYFADVVVVTGGTDGLDGRELYRVLRPCGGQMIFAAPAEPDAPERLLRETGAPPSEVLAAGGDVPMLIRGPLPGAGEWRHQWADGGRTGIGAESRLTLPLELLWFGGPGPDRMMDRHFGSSPPLSVNGRVFVTGEHDLIAFDAYNGRELWSRPMRGLGRRGAMWNAANFVADDALVYVALGPACYGVSQESGELVATYPIPPDVAQEPGAWAYIETAGELLLGNCEAGSTLFALDKRNGALRWQWRPKHNVPLAAIAYGGGRLYCLDLEPPDEQARRRGELKKPVRSLVALGLDDGAEVWRRDDVPKTPSDQVQFAKGVVCVYANAAYDAESGALLWQKPVFPERPPLIRGDWVIAQPHAYHLRTGEQRMATDLLTGEERPWEYIQSYGCGGVAGCQSMLFFRSAVAGFYDFAQDATTTFGGVRVGCSINMVAANGLAILPETSSGCACTYNFQTSLALVPAEKSKPAPWFVLAGRPSSQPSTHVHLNLGAPGDRLEADGTRWLGMPRPILAGAAPVAMNVLSKSAVFYRHPREDELEGLERPWLYGSGVRDPGRISVDLVSLKPAVALACEQPLIIDGTLDASIEEAKDNERIRLGFSNGLKRSADVYFRYDEERLYIAIQTMQDPTDEAAAPWVADCQGGDARVWEDDSWEVYLSDGDRNAGIQLGVSASGARFDARWDYTVFEALRGLERGWNGVWTSAAALEDDTMTIEMAVPFATLEDAGLDRDSLCLNLLGTPPGTLGSPDFLSINQDEFCIRWRGFVEAPADGAYAFTIRADHTTLLRIGGETVIEHKGTSAPAETSGAISMKAGGRLPLEMVYEAGHNADVVQLYWSSSSMPKTIVPASALYSSAGEPGGLSAAYSNRWFEDPVLERIDGAIDFEWGEADLRTQPKAELRWQGGQRPRRAEAFLPLSFGPPKVDGAFTVRLHFAELEPLQPGQRLFDVKLQDQVVLEAFDIVREAGGRNVPLIKEFKGIAVGNDGKLNVELVPRADVQSAPDHAPILNGIEIAAD